MDENKDKSPVCIPFFAHENSMMHYNRVNRRMMIIIITVCVSFVLTIAVFVHNYTKREKEWINLFASMYPQTEVTDGIHEQSDTADYP